MSDSPNPHRNPRPWNRVLIGGRLIKAVLRDVDGNKIEDDWHDQKPTGSSGATWVFKGTKPVGPFKLTFESVNAEDFDDLGDIYEMLAPKPGLGGTSSDGKANAYTIGQTKDASSAPAGGGTAAPVTVPEKTAAADAKKEDKGSNPGPRPPVLSIENQYFAYLGVTAVSRKSWEGPKITETNSYKVIIELVAQKAPVSAGTGIAPAKSGDKFTIGPTKNQPDGGGGGGGSAQADKDAAAAGAGT